MNDGGRKWRTWLPFGAFVAACVWVVVRSGTGFLGEPEGGLLAAAAWPQTTDQWELDFLGESPINLIIVRALGIETARGWYLLHATATVLAIAAWAIVTAGASTRGHRWTASRWIILTPFAAVLLAWIGSYDPFTVITLAIVFLGLVMNRVWLLGLGAFLLGIQHFEQGVLSLLALAFTTAALGSQSPITVPRSRWWLVAIGLVAGKILLLATLAISRGGLDGRSSWLEQYLGEWTLTAANIFPLLLWSLFAGAWGIVITQAVNLGSLRARLLLLAAFLVCILGLTLSGDRPRVFVIVALPALALLTASLLGEERDRRVLIVVESMLWLGTPIIFWTADVANATVIDLTWGSFLTFLTLP